jgi:ubiquinone/menaquinone biosynthesis C-methylase UbiE
MTARADSSNAIHDAIADRYGYEVGRDVTSRLKHELVRRHLVAGDRVLDVGSANGIHLRLVAPHCRSAVGVDINRRMIELARARLAADGCENASILEASAEELPFPAGEFDLVYSFSTLLLVPDLDAALGEIARVVRPGGTTILDLTGRYNLSARHWRGWYRSQGHFGLHALSLPRALEAHRRLGLRAVEVHGLGIADQWKYVRGLARLDWLDRVFHGGGRPRDLDYRLSNLGPLRRLANRWYVVARRDSAPPR